MFRHTLAILLCLLFPFFANAQKEENKITDTTQLAEVIIISQQSISDKEAKPLSTLDHYLSKANAINMIRRGSYAWEPFLNDMASERSVITIDGMRIYGACTDKMDPVTSYVEITNLSKANIHSGQSGATGATIGGSLDLERKKSSFEKKNFNGLLFSGYETNNQQKIIGTALSYSSPKFFTDVDFTFRDAKNYKAGGGKEILYSQFRKYNFSATTGYKISEHQHVEASIIYDRATNVGYPALPMDVLLAKAFIGSLSYIRHHVSPHIHLWQTKFYYNDVTHIMDDSKRPVVAIRMDMPGWSKTAGFYSTLQGEIEKHNWKATLSGHHNESLAEMTMYPNATGEKAMFMLTWPGVYTNYGDLFIEDKYPIATHWASIFSVGVALHNNVVNSKFGYESMSIFYPEMERSKTRILKRAAASIQYSGEHWNTTIGLAYGERAPSVSEGYGFYLFNSFDRFDYIGNPEMNNEQSASFSGAVSFHQSKFRTKLSLANFYISNYIIGKPQPGLSVMTIGAMGVKVYEQLKYANIFNSSVDINYQIMECLLWTNKLSYRMGAADGIKNLPLIQPFTYSSNLAYALKTFTIDIGITGAAKQNKYNPDFGEQPLPAFMVANLSAFNRFKLLKHSLLLKAGVENIFDENYTTFADWNRLPRMGRNFYLNVIVNF